MKLKRLVVRTMVAGGLGLPAIGLGMGAANSDPSSPPLPTPPNPAFVLVIDAATPTGLTALTAPGNSVAPSTTQTFTGANVAGRSPYGQALNPRGIVSRQLRLCGRLGDCGLFGVVRQEAVGLDLVAVQAERYDTDSTVEGPDIQASDEALQGAPTSPGVS